MKISGGKIFYRIGRATFLNSNNKPQISQMTPIIDCEFGGFICSINLSD